MTEQEVKNMANVAKSLDRALAIVEKQKTVIGKMLNVFGRHKDEPLVKAVFDCIGRSVTYLKAAINQSNKSVKRAARTDCERAAIAKALRLIQDADQSIQQGQKHPKDEQGTPVLTLLMVAASLLEFGTDEDFNEVLGNLLKAIECFRFGCDYEYCPLNEAIEIVTGLVKDGKKEA